MSPEPDLTSELDAAETVLTEWGVRYGGIDPRVIPYGTSSNSERMARLDAATDGEAVVRRTVTYGPWCEVNESAPAGAVKEDEGWTPPTPGR